jgi:hypothetical protein
VDLRHAPQKLEAVLKQHASCEWAYLPKGA